MIITCTGVLVVLSLSLGHQMCCTVITKSLVCFQQLGLESQTKRRHESPARMSDKGHGNSGLTYALYARRFEGLVRIEL